MKDGNNGYKPRIIVLADLNDGARKIIELASKKVVSGGFGKFPPHNRDLPLHKHIFPDGSVLTETHWSKYVGRCVIHVKQLVTNEGKVIPESVWPEEALRSLAI